MLRQVFSKALNTAQACVLETFGGKLNLRCWFFFLSDSGVAFKCLWGAFWEAFGSSWEHFGRPWGTLGALLVPWGITLGNFGTRWGHFGSLGGHFELFWDALGARRITFRSFPQQS